MNTKPVFPEMRSLPVTERLSLPDRAELLPQIESGQLDHLDFRARVFVMGPNRNSYNFRQQDMADFAASFEGQPFLRDHATYTVDSRDGTILSSQMDGSTMIQDVRLTTRRGMTDYIEGKLDRFSIGWWDYTDITCNICNDSFLSQNCEHWPGRTYRLPGGASAKCEITFVQPKGKETSAVNTPAVPGTGIEAALQCKLDIINEFENLVVEKPGSGELVSEQALTTQESPENLAAQARHAERAGRLETAQGYTLQGVNPMNVREMMKRRATCIEQARALHSLAEQEARDLGEDERAQFNALMDEADKLQGQIETIKAERARLEIAEASLETLSSDPEKPAGTTTPKALKRPAFDALSPAERAAFVRGGGKIED
jgi:hypothetical protein